MSIVSLTARAALIAGLVVADVYLFESPPESPAWLPVPGSGSSPGVARVASARTPSESAIDRFAASTIPDEPAAFVIAVPRLAVESAPTPPLLAARPDYPAYDPDLGIAIDPGDYRLSDTGPEMAEQASESDQPEAVEQVLQVQRGDTLLELFLRAGVNRAEAHEAISAMRGVFDPRDLKIGQEITLTLTPAPDNGESAGSSPGMLLAAASFAPRPDRDVNLSRGDDGRFQAEQKTRPLTRTLVRAAGTVRSSLFVAGSAAGVPGPIMIELIRAFSYDVDFQRDLQPEDGFEVVFERFADEDGRFAKDGVVLYGSLTLSGIAKRVYRFTPPDGETGYFNERGESVRKALLRTPIDGARLTSGFGSRMHPILGYTAFHRGVDFGAPAGTPIQAAGEGTIEQAGWNGGYGNYVRLRHNGEYATAYAHMSRLAAGVKPGARIRQGQVIGYVGSTGRSTGAHLHYEILRRGAQVNPVGVKFPTGRKLEGVELAQFRSARATIDLTVAGLEPTTQVVRVK